jgi:uncharacterized membrane protein YhhN
MIQAAILAIGADTQYPGIAWGALLFVVWDSIIGVTRFRTPVPMGDYLVWGTYYIAQCSLALGFMRGRPEPRHAPHGRQRMRT